MMLNEYSVASKMGAGIQQQFFDPPPKKNERARVEPVRAMSGDLTDDWSETVFNCSYHVSDDCALESHTQSLLISCMTSAH